MLPVSRSAASVTAPVSDRDIGIARRQSAIAASVTPSTHQPPSRASPSTASAASSSRAHSRDQFGGHLRGVHSDLQHRQPAGGRGGVDVRVGQPLGEVGAALRHDSEIGQAETGSRRRGSPAPSSPVSATTRAATGAAATASSVSSSAAAAMSAAAVIADAGRQPRLRLPGHRRLGDHQHDDGDHEITRQKSSAAMKLPRTEPLTFDLPPVRGP